MKFILLLLLLFYGASYGIEANNNINAKKVHIVNKYINLDVANVESRNNLLELSEINGLYQNEVNVEACEGILDIEKNQLILYKNVRIRYKFYIMNASKVIFNFKKNTCQSKDLV